MEVMSNMFSRRHMTAEPLNLSRVAKEAKVEHWLEVMEYNAQERAKRSAAQQLAVLDKRLGKGVGAKRERKRLNEVVAKKVAKKGKK